MTRLAAAYGAIAAVFVILDAIWLTLVAPRVYRPVETVLLSGQLKFLPAIAFYVLYVAGVVYFAVRPALASGRWSDALLAGALFGLVAYGTFALTNHAVMKNWTASMTLADMTWGAIITGMGALAGFFVASLLEK